ncbi:MAG: aspartate/glutamate racemase family protein [Bacilli bacterium]
MKLGIIGGVGPLAGYDFGKRLTKATPVKNDQDHINAILLSDTSIPDRTEYILGKSKINPLLKLSEDVNILNKLNVDRIAIICNTAHFFYEELAKISNAKIYNMVDITMSSHINHKIGLISTQGTKNSKIYDKYAEKYNIELITLDDFHQEICTNIIYSQVKNNLEICEKDFRAICDYLFSKGCEHIILGCTELSTAKVQFLLNDIYIDPVNELIKEIVTDFYGGNLCVDS